MMNVANSIPSIKAGPDQIDQQLQRWVESGRRIVHEADSKRILAMAGLPVPGAPEDGTAVVKFCSDDALHKSELGLVTLNVLADAVSQEQHILEDRARHAGLANGEILVESMVEDALMEWFVGCRTDATFGPVVVIGAGGVYAELLGAPEIRMAPLSNWDAEQALRSHKAFPIINGARGKKAANIAEFARLISAVSEFFYRRSHLVAEMDLNPVMVRSRDATPSLVIADASLILQKPAD